MKSTTSRDFWSFYHRLPRDIQNISRIKYALWRDNPTHPSLRFKRIKDDIWSVRITIDYRALCLRDGEIVAWVWIGRHNDYDRILGH